MACGKSRGSWFEAMKKFHFPLERVLQWRRIEAQLRCAELARTHASEELLNAQRTQLKEHVIAARMHPSDSFSASEMYPLAAFERRCQLLDVAMEKQCFALRATAAAETERVTDAHLRVKLLEKLRERYQNDWTKESEAAQERFAAEAFLCRWSVPDSRR
jgi:hypothetical protein